MPIEFEEIDDQERLAIAYKNIGEILRIDAAKIQNYFILVYDGTDELKADTDIPEVDIVVRTLSVFLEHLTGRKVFLGEDLPPGGFLNDSGEVDNR